MFNLSDNIIAPQLNSQVDVGTTAKPVQISLGSAICVGFEDGTLRCAGDTSNGANGWGYPILRLSPPSTAVINLAE